MENNGPLRSASSPDRLRPDHRKGDQEPERLEATSLGAALEYCPNCSRKLMGRQCKLLCPQCGYFLSCSDYY